MGYGSQDAQVQGAGEVTCALVPDCVLSLHVPMSRAEHHHTKSTVLLSSRCQPHAYLVQLVVCCWSLLHWYPACYGRIGRVLLVLPIS